MFDLITTVLKYFFAWLTILFAVLIAIFSETIVIYISSFFKKSSKDKTLVYPMNLMKNQFTSKVIFPDLSCTIVALLGPLFAFSALMPICAAIPFFSFIPILANTPDLLQIAQFFILSDTLAIISVYALGTKNSNSVAYKMSIDSIYLIFSLLAFFTVIAGYIEISGTKIDGFRLNSVAVFDTLTTFSSSIYLMMFLFVFLIFSQLPPENKKEANSFLNDSSLAEFQGVLRLVLLLWSLFRSLIITALLVLIVSPLPSVPLKYQPWGISWIPQFINFLGFWFTVMLTKIFLVPIFWKILDSFKSKVSNKLSPFVLPAFITVVIIITFIPIIAF